MSVKSGGEGERVGGEGGGGRRERGGGVVLKFEFKSPSTK
jgi:hypothetical protein